MSPVPASISRLLRRQAQSILQMNPSLATSPSLRQSLWQTRTIFSQQSPQSSRLRAQLRAQTPSKYGKKGYNPQTTFFQKRFSSTSSTGANAGSQQAQAQTQSISQRLKALSREYGWSAVGVYFALSALDFPFCFAAVRLFGVERIGHYEHVVVEESKRLFYSVMPFERPAKVKVEDEGEEREEGNAKSADMTDEGASIWTQLAIAYAVHKSFIFIRVPLTAAVTPKIVKTLRGWGWNIGKKAPKSPPKTTN